MSPVYRGACDLWQWGASVGEEEGEKLPKRTFLGADVDGDDGAVGVEDAEGCVEIAHVAFAMT